MLIKYLHTPIHDHYVDLAHYSDEVRILTEYGYDLTETWALDRNGDVFELSILRRLGQVVKIYEGESSPF